MSNKSQSTAHFAIFFVLASCVAHERTYKVNNESVVAKINETPELVTAAALNPPQQTIVSRGLGATIAAKGISVAVDGMKKLIEKDKKKYTAEYKAGLNENQFYNNLSTKGAMDFQGIKFDGVNLVRYFSDSKDPKAKKDTAVYMSLAVDKIRPFPYDLINNSIFRLRLADFKLPYAKCKVPDHQWYLPWTLFYKVRNTIDIQVDINVKATWMTQEGVFYDKIEIGKFSYFFENLPIDKIKQKQRIDSLVNDPKKSKLSGYSMLVPRSFGYYPAPSTNLQDSIKIEACWGQGLYNISFVVKETSDKSKIIDAALGYGPDAIDAGAKQIPAIK